MMPIKRELPELPYTGMVKSGTIKLRLASESFRILNMFGSAITEVLGLRITKTTK